MADKKKDALATTQPTAVAEFKPDVIENVAEYMAGFELVEVVALEQDQTGFVGQFLGRGADLEFTRGDGAGVDIVGTWRFQIGENVIRLRGSTVLDRALGGISKEYKLPVIVRVVRIGEEKLKGGHTMCRYSVGVVKNAPRAIVETTAEDKPPF